MAYGKADDTTQYGKSADRDPNTYADMKKEVDDLMLGSWISFGIAGAAAIGAIVAAVVDEDPGEQKSTVAPLVLRNGGGGAMLRVEF